MYTCYNCLRPGCVTEPPERHLHHCVYEGARSCICGRALGDGSDQYIRTMLTEKEARFIELYRAKMIARKEMYA